jgi:hypothetical protein
MNRETRIGIGVVVALGAFVFFMLTVGSLGGVKPELTQLPVGVVLADGYPAVRHGDAEIRISGWYAELAGDCEDVTQAELERLGLRLAAPTGRPFPSRAEPGGPNLRLEQLVFVGHFDDPASANCVPDRVDRCRNTFVVSDYDGLVR